MSSVTPSTAFTTPRDREKSVPPASGKWTFRSLIEIRGSVSRSDMLLFRLCEHFVREMTKRVMLGRQLHERRKVTTADILRPFTSRRKRTTRRQVGEIWGRPGNLIKPSLLISRNRNRAQ